MNKEDDPELAELRALAEEQDLAEKEHMDWLRNHRAKKGEVSVESLKAFGGKVIKAKIRGDRLDEKAERPAARWAGASLA